MRQMKFYFFGLDFEIGKYVNFDYFQTQSMKHPLNRCLLYFGTLFFINLKKI